ncbi:MAG: NAD/NADP octopine/nopaline dehydrogenase family protein [Bacteroidales bacterium]|nr:NAD/NADP octopine/nopaline dehydrogenase family protein [Bacteroidales bacterium]
MKKQLVICGGGSSAHTLIPLLKDSVFEVSILTSRPEKWHDGIELEWRDTSGKLMGKYSNVLKKASKDPRELIPQADYIVFCMPVHKYRLCLHEIAPYINKNKVVFLGTLYGQAGYNWMVDEIKEQQSLDKVVTFAFGLLPWICRTIEYGRIGVTFGGKAVNYAACYPKSYFKQLNNELFENIGYKWFGKGHTEQADNFLSLTLSVDNQIIHPSRCYALCKIHGNTWENKNDIPMFYRDYDDYSAEILKRLDDDYSKVRLEIKRLFPKKRFSHMLDYLSLEHFSYQSSSKDIKDSFVNSKTLTSIETPSRRNEQGRWEIDTNCRFFMDDIYYGIMIAKWIAERLNIETPTIVEILRWVEQVRNECLLDDSGNLLIQNNGRRNVYKTGLPSEYGKQTIFDIMD